MRGIVLELFSLGGLIAGILLASWNFQRLAIPLQHLLDSLFKFSLSTCNVIAFIVIVFTVMVLAALLARLIRGTARTIGLGFFDRLLGAVFGALRGCLIGVSILMAVTAFLPQSQPQTQTQVQWFAKSRLAPYFLAGVHAVSFVVPTGLQHQLLNGIAQLKHNAPDWIKQPPWAHN
jgi:membrane protein required for colicin V production